METAPPQSVSSSTNNANKTASQLLLATVDFYSCLGKKEDEIVCFIELRKIKNSTSKSFPDVTFHNFKDEGISFCFENAKVCDFGVELIFRKLLTVCFCTLHRIAMDIRNSLGNSLGI
jgi:hypothetical protein